MLKSAVGRPAPVAGLRVCGTCWPVPKLMMTRCGELLSERPTAFRVEVTVFTVLIVGRVVMGWVAPALNIGGVAETPQLAGLVLVTSKRQRLPSRSPA